MRRPNRVSTWPCALAKAMVAVHVLADAGEALEVGVDEALGVLARDAEVVGEPEGRDAVDDAEVDRLGLAADVGGHALDRHAEHLGGGHRVDVEAVAERLLQRLDVGHVGEDAELDLGVVEAEQHVARLGDEGLADAAALLGADRDVLQVRVDRGEPAGGGAGDLVGGVDAAGLGVDRVLQRVGVGRLQLREHPPVEDARRQVVALGGELLQHVGAGARRRRSCPCLPPPRLIWSKRISPSCFGEPTLKLLAGERRGSRPRAPPCAGRSRRRAARARARSTRTPCASIAASTGTSGRSMRLVDPGDAGERQPRLQRLHRRQTTSACSAA